MKGISLIQSVSARFADEIGEEELQRPDYITVVKVVWFSIRSKL